MQYFLRYICKIITLLVFSTISLTAFSCNPHQPKNLEKLIKVLGAKRFTEARLTGGFSYGQLKLPSLEIDKKSYSSQEPFLLSDNKNRGNTDDEEKLLSEVALDIYSDAGSSPSSSKLHELGILNLLQGHYTKAIDYLEKAVNADKINSKFLNDLAVAYIERGTQQKSSEDLFHSLSLIDEVISLDNSLVETQFNLALVLEKLFLVSTAKKTWQEYLAIEKDPNWQQEAQIHINNLLKETETELWLKAEKFLISAIEKGDQETSKSIIKQFPHQARLYVLEELMPQWANAIQKKQKEKATNIVKIANLIGQTLSESQGDKEIKDMVVAILEAKDDSDKEILLASAYLDYIAGRKAFDVYESKKAFILFQKAIVKFSQAKTQINRAWAIFHKARCSLVSLDYKEVLKQFNIINSLVENNSYLYLKARILWIKGLINNFQHNLSEGLENQKMALDCLEELGDSEGVAMLNNLIASSLVDIGNKDETWQHIHEAIKISKVPNSFWYTSIFNGSPLYFFKIGEVRAAKYMYQEAKEQVLNKDNEVAKSTLFLRKSRTNYLLQNQKEALEDLTKAKEHLTKISDRDHKKNVEQELLIIEADLSVVSQPKTAIIAYDRLLNNLPSKDKVYTTHIYASRAKAYLALGDYEKAEADLKAGIKEFELQRSKITDERYRLSFFEDPQSVYEEMIKFQINQRKRLDLAFNYLEDARARALLDAIDGRARAIKLDTRQELKLDGTAKPFNLEQVQQALPENVVMIRYLVTADKLYAWIITKEKVDLVEQNIVEAELERQILRLRKTIIDYTSPLSAIQAAINPVYQAVFEKITPYLKPLNSNTNPTLIIIPDKALYAIPFAALQDPVAKRYLVEDYAIGISPSATVYLRCLERDRRIAKNMDETILSVGNPTFRKKHFEGMNYLSGAEAEAEAVSTIYPNSTSLLTENATKEAFLKEMTNHTVIHYAGHALIDPSSPLFSKLVMAAPENALESYDEALYAHEIYGYKFDKTKLVVLAACRTAGGLRTHGEGMISLARPFLASGVPAVIASLWDANDKASLDLFKVFHKKRAAGHNSLEALQLAQIELIKDESPLRNSPRMWSLFQVIGGVDLVKPKEIDPLSQPINKPRTK